MPHPPDPPPPSPSQCLRLTAKILFRRLRCQEDLRFKILGPPPAGTIGGPWEEGGPSQPPSPPAPLLTPPPPLLIHPCHPPYCANVNDLQKYDEFPDTNATHFLPRYLMAPIRVRNAIPSTYSASCFRCALSHVNCMNPPDASLPHIEAFGAQAGRGLFGQG